MGKNLSEAAKLLIVFAEIAGEKDEKRKTKRKSKLKRSALGEDKADTPMYWRNLSIIANILDPDAEDLPEDIFSIPGQGLDTIRIWFQTSERYRKFDNIYWAIEALVEFNKLNLLPPKWVISVLCERFEKHLKDPDPDVFAKQMGITGEGSGKTNRFQEWKRYGEVQEFVKEMSLLGEMFTITKTDAARAVKLKHNSDLNVRTITNWYHQEYGDSDFHAPPPFSLPGRGWPDKNVDDYLRTYPAEARRFIRKYKRIR